MSKNFKDDAVSIFLTQNAHDTQDAQAAHKELEEQKVQKTQERKGHKLQRINMAFSDSNIEYLRLMSRLKGISQTQYVNNLLEKDIEKNKDLIEKAKELLDM